VSHIAPDSELSAACCGWDRLRLPVWVFDPVSYRGLYANPAALKLWGAASQQELLARDFSNLSVAVRTRVQRLAQATANGEAVSERWTFYPRGRPVTVQALISALPLGDSRSALLFEAEAVSPEEAERRAVEALRHTSSLITLFDLDGSDLFANPAAFAAYGGESRSDFVGRFSNAAQGAAALRRVVEGEVLAELRQMRTRAGERSHHLDARKVLDPVTGRACILLSERDVTAQVEAERALAAAHERADVAMAKQRFLANMSHELRTPLNGVLGFASLLAASGLSPKQSADLARITTSGEALLGCINDMIALAELDQGEVSLDLAPFDPADLVREGLASIGAAAAAKGLGLELVSPDSGLLVGDQARLGRVLGAFLSNAVKFTEGGAITLELRRRAAAQPGRTVLEIAVNDTGPGLSAQMQARLFQRFTPGDDSRGKQYAGGGLGLALAKELIELMRGEVGVDSTPGRGARFWLRVELPVVDAGVSAAPSAQAEPPAARPLAVLYADDNESNRLLVQTVLTSQGHRCDLANDGAAAVAAVRTGDYDLVLMDIQMPVQDGVEATLEIRALPCDIPILALTANTLADQLEAYAAAGMQDCIAKPVNMVELITKVTHWATGPARMRAAAAVA